MNSETFAIFQTLIFYINSTQHDAELFMDKGEGI